MNTKKELKIHLVQAVLEKSLKICQKNALFAPCIHINCIQDSCDILTCRLIGRDREKQRESKREG